MAGGPARAPSRASLSRGSLTIAGLWNISGRRKNAASRIGASTVARKIAKENVMPETRCGKNS